MTFPVKSPARAYTKSQGLVIVSALTIFAVCVHGYHPYGEDGGLYIAGIKKLLDPALYPTWTEFVTEHLRFSLFAPAVAALTHVTHLGLQSILFLLYCAGVWLTLSAGWMLLSRTAAGLAGRAGGVTLLACWLTLPLAGTSLMLMDPYVTARTFSTPLTLFALAWALDFANTRRHLLRLLAALALAAAAHPLMAGYAAAAVAVLLVTTATDRRTRTFGPWLLLLVALSGAGVVQAYAPAESKDYVWVAMTRYYWFPFRWEWYEQVGLFAPLLLIAWLGRLSIDHQPSQRAGQPQNTSWQALARTALILAGITLAVALLFSRARLQTHLVARMQPLRAYGVVYEIMTLLLGAWLGERVLNRSAWRWMAMVAFFGGLMFYVQRQIYPASAHLELPGRSAQNPCVQAFLWARVHTPPDALFALDAHYITHASEDAQAFRAIAERSALPDYSKDGGEASITPSLTEAWVQGQAAQTGLEIQPDALRLRMLRPYGVSWIVLTATSSTAFRCPYHNQAVKVCELPKDLP